MMKCIANVISRPVRVNVRKTAAVARRSLATGCVVVLLLGVLFCAAAMAADADVPTVLPVLGEPPELHDLAVQLEDLQNAGKCEEVRAICEQRLAAATDPDHRAYLLWFIGRTYAKEWRLDKAVELYQQVLTQYPNSRQDWWVKYFLAKAYEAKAVVGTPTEESAALAIPLLDGLVRDNPQHIARVQTLDLLATCYERVGNDEAALATYQKAIDLYPIHSSFCFLPAIALLQKAGRWDESISLGRRYVETYSCFNPIGIELMVATAYIAKGDDLSALHEMEQAITRYPDAAEACANAWDGLTERAYEHGRGVHIASLAQGLLARCSAGEQAAFAKLAMGESLRRDNDRAGALEWFKRVLVEHPQSKFAFPARYWAGWCLIAQHPTEAIPYFQEVVAQDSNDWRKARALWCLGACYSVLEQWDQAQTAYQRLLSQSHEQYTYFRAGAHANIGLNYYRQQQYDQAKREFELTIACYPGTGPAQRAQYILAHHRFVREASGRETMQMMLRTNTFWITALTIIAGGPQILGPIEGQWRLQLGTDSARVHR